MSCGHLNPPGKRLAAPTAGMERCLPRGEIALPQLWGNCWGPMARPPPKGASAHLDLRSSCDLHVLPQCGNALVSFLPAHTLDTIKAAEMKSLDFCGKVFIGHNKYIHAVIFESTLFSLSSLHFAYFVRHEKNSSWPKREVFKKKT